MTSDTGGDPVPNMSDQDKDRDEYSTKSKSKFRFKSKRSLQADDQPRGSLHESHRDEKRHHRHYHRSKRRKRSISPSQSKDDPALYDDTHIPNAASNQFPDPEVAFRESLFDAMADDEGAAFWEGVYGQPIHTYPDIKEGPTGELERMTDDEYTAYVRAKMYEKTHQHLLEEKARRDAAKKERERLAKEGREQEREAEVFRRKVEDSLKRGEERKKRKSWGERWGKYTSEWDDLAKGDSNVAFASIPWPVESGRKKDVNLEEVKKFFLYAPTSGQSTEMQLNKTLKSERIRWHPDKIQQKLGGQNVSEDVIQAVTEVFQLIDRLWSESREKK